jgi:hypothetical protein
MKRHTLFWPVTLQKEKTGMCRLLISDANHGRSDTSLCE